MKKTVQILMVAAVMVIGTAAFAGPRHKKHQRNDGLKLACGIVNLVTNVIRPAPAVAVPAYRRPVVYHRAKPHKVVQRPHKATRRTPHKVTKRRR